MFSGLVQELGRVRRVERSDAGARLVVSTSLAGELRAGDSVAVNGVCLSTATVDAGAFSADVMNETLSRTSLGTLGAEMAVNLELALRVGDRLGGHIVQGHVDGVGRIGEVLPDGFSRRVRIHVAPELLRYVVEKGSIAIDGVSLTVAEAGTDWLSVSLIPETLARTNLGGAERGQTVNLEVDVLAKYVEKLVAR